MLTQITNITSTTAELASPYLVNFTKVLNEVGTPNNVDRFMDAKAGLGHRVAHGHDLSYLPEVFDKFGLDGVAKFFKHLLTADLMSPHGIPFLPYTKEIGQFLGLSTKQTLDWMCLNIGDLVGGGLAIATSYTNYKLIMSGPVDSQKLALIGVSAAVKLTASTLTPNPITFLTSVFDLGLVVYATMPIVFEFFVPKFSFKSALYGSVQAGSISFLTDAAYRTFIEYREKRNLKEMDFLQIAKGASITGLSASVASIIYDSSKFYISNNETLLAGLSITSFVSAKISLESLFNKLSSVSQKHVKNSRCMVDSHLIPSF